jgi:hypothetical protein
MEKLDVLIPVITTIIGSVTTMLVIWYKHKLERNKQKNECPIVKCVAEDSELLDKLTEVNKSLKSDRISIYSFHNGGEYYSGKSMQKMSVSYEVVDKGIAATQLEKQNIPVSACITTLGLLLENGEMHCSDTKKYPEGLCKYHLDKDGVKSTYQWPITDIGERLIGMLRIDYVKRKGNLNEQEFKDIAVLCNKLPGYLSSVKK